MKLFVATLLILSGASNLLPQQRPITLRAGVLLDGKGGMRQHMRITVQNGKIQAVTPDTGTPATFDLSSYTVMPGWIDTHVHITWHFGPNGHLEDKSETPEQEVIGFQSNAWKTLLSGFTTVQSLGSTQDKDLRDAINHGDIPGPRILTSLNPIDDKTGDMQKIREAVRKLKTDGADVVKIFASGSIRQGGKRTLTDGQLEAACGEASSLGLRSVVHAYGSAVRAAAKAGCTAVEHGTFAAQEDLRAMAEHGTFFDPQIGLVIHNYIQNKQRFLGSEGYTEEGFTEMEKALPLDADLMKRALKIPGLKIVFGTDAVAGAHGRNAEEFIDRVHDGDQQPMAALVAANQTAAESLHLENEIGTIAPGLRADIIAVQSDPIADITAVRNVVFIMKDGVVYKCSHSSQ